MDAVQLFGGNGYMTEYRVEQLARDAKSLMIYAGSNEVQITHVAKGLLDWLASAAKGHDYGGTSGVSAPARVGSVGAPGRSGTGRSPRPTPR